MRSAIAVLALLVAFAGRPAFAQSANRMETFIISEGQHPDAYQHALVVPHDSEGRVQICFGYANDGRLGGEGYLRGTATVTRVDPDSDEVRTWKIKKRGGIQKNKWLRCVDFGPVHEGDTVVFDYTMRKFPRIRGATIHIRSSIGEDRMRLDELRGPEGTGNLGEPIEFYHRVRSNVSESGKHPKTWQQAFVVPATSVAETIHFCFGYGNDFKKANKGSFRARAEISRTDPDTGEVTRESLRVKAKLEANKAKRCKDIGRVSLGDSVVVDYTFTGFPRVKSDQTFQIKTGIGPKPMADREIYGPPPERPGGNPGPPNPNPSPEPAPNPGGNISAADQLAASSLLYKSVRTQLWRFRNNQPKHWTVIGPRTQLGNGLGGVNPNTTGYGDTITAAVKDYERKMGPLPSGSGLSASDVAALEWYQKINTASGPTSIRRDGGGTFHGEYYRVGRGSIHRSGFSSITAVVNWFKSQGL
ncbi:MAG: hypothetical protein OEM62_00890 [Acidobacteriota bacterium]|nr:hypothetical protein [Acidobacteriota bacterium]